MFDKLAWNIVLGVECVLSVSLVGFGILICCKFPDFIFKKCAMTALYFSYFVAISANNLYAFIRDSNFEQKSDYL